MSESESMMKFVKSQIKVFSKIMKATNEDGPEYDYAYAEGSFDAYSVILKKLEGEENK
jgi:hypothetical protein